ncbi:MAG: hypothetical protein JW894_07455 [Bacteroidales bacterium]|nr:hypothetical protein [Bacteroidales bacterium]
MAGNKKYDLFITFPDQLEDTDAKLFELINSYIRNLEIAIQRILSRKIIIAFKKNDFKHDNFEQYLKGSSLAVFFTHNSFIDNENYTTELEGICETFGDEDFDPLHGNSKIFNINLEPLKKELKPECLNQLMPYDFYEKNVYNRRIISLGFDNPDNALAVYGKLLDLSYDLASILEPGLKFSPTDGENIRYIYLGFTTSDQQQSRNEIRRELQHCGFRVLPLLNIPPFSEKFKEILLSNLEISETIVQIMGSQYGEILKGTKYSLIDFQNQVIKEFQDSQRSKKIKRYIWIPQNLKINDQRQTLYLKRLRRDEAGSNTEIIESPLETFKTILSERLENTNHSARMDYENISRTYILTEDESTPDFEQLYSTLSLSGLKVLTLDQNEQIGIYARHLQALKDCDSVIIYQQGDSEYWLNSKIRDLIKSPGIGRRSPFKKVVVCAKSLPDEELMDMVQANVEIMKNDDSSPDLILQKLISDDYQ